MPHNDQKAFKLNTILIVSWLFIAAVYTGVSLLFKLHQQEVVETLDIVDMLEWIILVWDCCCKPVKSAK